MWDLTFELLRIKTYISLATNQPTDIQLYSRQNSEVSLPTNVIMRGLSMEGKKRAKASSSQ